MDDIEFAAHENAVRILEEGWRMFQELGYRGVTVEALCARCGITKPTLYYYFGDKENLFVQVLRHKLHGFHLAIERPGTLAARLAGFAQSVLDSFQAEYGILLRDRQHLRRPESLAGVRAAFREEMFAPLSALMRDGIEAGKLAGDSPDVLARLFLGIINNFIGKAGDMGLENAALAQKLTNYFLHGAGHNER